MNKIESAFKEMMEDVQMSFVMIAYCMKDKALEIERELNAVTEQRDEVSETLESLTTTAFDLLASLGRAREERDRLADALRRIVTIYENPEKGCIPSSSDMYDEALQSLTTNAELTHPESKP